MDRSAHWVFEGSAATVNKDPQDKAQSKATYAEKFELLLDLFPHPSREHLDDPKKRKWKASELSEATNGQLSGGYLTGLKHERIKRPGPEHLHLISQVMDFPFELWVLEPYQWSAKLQARHAHRIRQQLAHQQEQSIAQRIERLFRSVPDRQSGTLYTNRRVAELSNGRLTEQEVAELRSGHIDNPTRLQLLALCDIFDVAFSFWEEDTEKELILDQEIIEALRSDRGHLLLQKTSGLGNSRMDMLLAIVEELRNLNGDDDEDAYNPST